MIVGGIVLRNTGMTGGNPQTFIPALELSVVLQVPSSDKSAPVTTEPGSTHGGKTTPRPWINVGSPQVMIATSILSHFLATEWAQNLMAEWSGETIMPDGSPLAY